MNAKQVLLILRYRWWLVLVMFVLTLAAAFAYVSLVPKRFEATTTVLLDVKTDPLVATLAPNLAQPAFMATQTEIIRSERLAGRVVSMLGLGKTPEAVAQWREATQGRVPLEVYFGDFLQSGLKVEPGRGSSIMSLTYVARDPKFAASAANAFAQAYLDLTVELKVGPAREYASFFDDRLKALRSDLEVAQSRVSEFQRKKGIIVTAERLDIETARLTALESSLASALANSAETSSRQRHTGSETSVDVQESGGVQSLRGELARAETRLNEISTTYGPNHPTRIQVEAQISELKQQLAQEMRRVSGATVATNRIATQKISELRSMVETQKRAVLSMRTDRDEASVLLKDLETAQRAYEQVAQRRAQLANESQAEQAAARVLSPATEPLAHATPNTPKIMMAAVALGVVLGLAAVLGWEVLDRRVRSEDDMHMIEGVPVLGVMSSHPTRSGELRRLPPAAASLASADARRRNPVSPVTMLSTKVRNADRTIGAILIDAGRLSPEDAERIFDYQTQAELRFGEAGVELGLLTESDILFALSLQFDYPYLQPGGSQPISREVVAAYQPFSVEGERLRALRSQLQLRWFDEASRRTALAIVSAKRNEGRSNLAANLAVTFAQLGQRTLLIDADLRAPRQHKLFKVDNQLGLSNLLAGRMQDQVVTFVHGIPGLAVLPSGPPPPNPAELLSRPTFARILEQSRSSFDAVLVDTPAYGSGADTALLSRSTGGVVAVARKHVTRTSDFQMVVGTLTDSGVEVVGSVLIEAEPGHRDASTAVKK